MKRSILLIVFAMAGTTCQDGGECLARNLYGSQFAYKVHAKETTPDGIRVDRSGQSYPSLEMIDGLVDDVEQCLIDQYGDPPVLSPEVMKAYGCSEDTFALPIARECITVKVPNDWFISRDGTQELLPYAGPKEGCLQKVLRHDPDATLADIEACFWRAGLQCSKTIVSTPSMYVFKDPLIRMATGCNNPWGVRIYHDGTYDDLAADLPADKRLSNCASPGASDVPARSPLPGKTYESGFQGYQVDPAKTGCGY